MRRSVDSPMYVKSCVIALGLVCASPVFGQSDEEQALKAVRERIEELENRRASELVELDRETAGLREIELRVAPRVLEGSDDGVEVRL